MAKALVNRGVPIKADNPKDPYIRDENGIKDIVDSSTTFGKTLGTANGKIQLKNGNTVLSEVTVPSGGGGTLLKSETTPQVVTFTIFYDNGTWKTNDFYRPDFTGYYYEVEKTGATAFPQEIITVQMYDMGDPMSTFTLDLRDMPAGSTTFYVYGTGVDTVEYYGTEAPVVTTEYDELTLGSDLSVSNGTLHGPNLSSYGKTLDIDGRYLSLKNGNTFLSGVNLPNPDLSLYGSSLSISGQNLSLVNHDGNTLNTVLIPSSGGGSSAGVTTYYANFSSGFSYLLSSDSVATEIFRKLDNDEDVQIVLAKTNGSKIICRCFGFRPYDEDIADAAYLFASVMYDLGADGIKIYSFDLMSGNRTLAVATLDVS